MRLQNLKQYLFLMIVLAIFFSCGYRFESLNPPLPQNARTIAIAPIKNDTFYSSLETRINRYLQLALQKNQSVVISYEKEADIVLYIHLKQLQTKKTTLSESGQSTASEWSLKGDITLYKDNRMLWGKQGVVIRNELSYDINQQNQGITTQSRGVDDIARQFANYVYEQIFINF